MVIRNTEMNAMSLPYRITVGLEIHAELNTATKMFCRCKNDPFGVQPNTNICPVCMGLPGTLPVANKEAVRKTILLGKALGSTTPAIAKWDRKHYFYPDLPKGYQISQYDLPFCQGGELSVLAPNGVPEFTVTFERVHLEEDAGKLLHGGKGTTKVDLNRAGVPLVEMVTKPDLHDPAHARAFVQEVRTLVRALGISEGDMEKGQMRCDVNISVQFEDENGKEISTGITEVKNVNSTRAVERSIQLEAQRLYDDWQAGGDTRTRTGKLTAGYDEDTNTVRINRLKEAAHEYRYFPEPDLPPVAVADDADLNPANMVLPELPNQVRLRYLAYGLVSAEVEVFLADAPRQRRLEELASAGIPLKLAANWLINAAESVALPAAYLSDLIALQERGEVAAGQIKQKMGDIVAACQGEEMPPLETILQNLGLLIAHDAAAVDEAITKVLAENQPAVQQFKDGNEKILGFIVGQVMKTAGSKANPAKVQLAVREALTR